MKQLLQDLRSGETVVAEVPVPQAKPGTALVKTAASLVSPGTERTLVEFAEKSLAGKARSRPDLVRQVLDKARREGVLTTVEAAFNRLDQPMPLGYSSAGRIVALGEGLTGYQVDQRVACAGGGYAVHAEYNVVPQNLLTPLPEGVAYESAAFATLGAIAMHGFRLSEAQVGARVAVIGLGLLGLLATGIARAAGCQVLGIDLEQKRVELAKSMGAQAVEREQAETAAQGFSRGRGCDVILICADTASNDPVELAGVIARDRANVVAVGAVGLQLPRKIYYEKELAFINSRSYGPGRYDPSYEEGGQDYPIGFVRWTEGRNLEAFVDLLADSQIDVKALITHRFPIERAAEAYELITGKREEHFLGVLLEYAEGGVIRNHVIRNEVIRNKAVRNKEYVTPKADSTSLTLGVLGAGNFATAVMLPALRKLDQIHLAGIASASGLSAKHALNRFNFQYATSDENEIIYDPDVNAVAILTRHHLHAQQVIAALKAGKHVFCEKPLAITPEELEKVSRLVNKSISRLVNKSISQSGDQSISRLGDQGIGGSGDEGTGNEGEAPLSSIPYPLLMVGFNRRFAPMSRRLKTFVELRQEPLAAHYRVNAGYLPPEHWLHDPEQGGGRIIGEGCHFIDFLTYLVGSPPVSITAQALPDDGRYREDNVVMNFSFADGSIGTVSYLANGDKAYPKERVEVFAGGRIGVLDDYRSLELVHNGKRKTERSRLRQDKGHRAEWEAFAKTILKGGEPPIPYEHIFGVMAATFAAVKALRSGEKITIDSFSK
ncbi:MAG TPA: bi-domain-containing oxidoreductase [Anaerolineales bacterium]